eukprot:256977_1
MPKRKKKLKNDFDYHKLESLRLRLDNVPECSNMNPTSAFLYEFESGSKILSFQQMQHLVSGFIRIHYGNCDTNNNNNDFSIATSIPFTEILKHSQFGYSNHFSLQNYNPFNIKQRKYCYNCYISNINDKYKSFLICSRCKTAKYCNQICQKNNWKYHKNTCKSIKKQKQSENIINLMSAKECIKQLQIQHRNTSFSFETIFY